MKNLALRGTRLARKRLAFLVRLSRRAGGTGPSRPPHSGRWLPMRLRPRRSRIWRTAPSKSSRVLWCSAADVSMCLQLSVPARWRPSAGRNWFRRLPGLHWVQGRSALGEVAGVHRKRTETSKRTRQGSVGRWKGDGE